MGGVFATSNPIFVPLTLINCAFNLGPPDASVQYTSTAPLAVLDANFVPLGPARRSTPAVTPLTERQWRSLPLAPWSFAGCHQPNPHPLRTPGHRHNSITAKATPCRRQRHLRATSFRPSRQPPHARLARPPARRAPCSASAAATPSRATSPPASVPRARRS